VTGDVRLGLRNARQFALLVALNALVGGMVGLERSVLPLIGEQDFGLTSTSAILAFVVAFGAAKRSRTSLPAGWRSGSAASDYSSSAGWWRCPCRC
jgi:hypothetical protein